MIFVDTNIHDWLLKYPNLKVISKDCDACGGEIVANKPFLTKGYAGLYGGVCSCGRNKHTAMSLVTTSAEKASEWNGLIRR